MAYEFCLSSAAVQLTASWLTLNRPEKLNALTMRCPPSCSTFPAGAARPPVRCIVITGATRFARGWTSPAAAVPSRSTSMVSALLPQ
jgi:enoyl-CoA hydratase/carnithine racemase